MGAQLMALDGQDDHAHLLIEYPPKLSVSVMVNALKGASSRLLPLDRPDIASKYWKGVLSSLSYFVVSAGGAPLETIKAYVEAQRAFLGTVSSPRGLPLYLPSMNGGVSREFR